jgi:hypothetical protein
MVVIPEANIPQIGISADLTQDRALEPLGQQEVARPDSPARAAVRMVSTSGGVPDARTGRLDAEVADEAHGIDGAQSHGALEMRDAGVGSLAIHLEPASPLPCPSGIGVECHGACQMRGGKLDKRARLGRDHLVLGSNCDLIAAGAKQALA